MSGRLDDRASLYGSVDQSMYSGFGFVNMRLPVHAAVEPQKAPLLPPVRGMVAEMSNVAALPVVSDPVTVPIAVLLVVKMQWVPMNSSVISMPFDLSEPLPLPLLVRVRVPFLMVLMVKFVQLV
jgi:hypothetical protein